MPSSMAARELPGPALGPVVDPSVPSRPTTPLELVDRCAGDTTSPAWNELVERYGRHLEEGARRALFRFGLRQRHDLIEDLVQEAYCRLLEDRARRLRTFRGTVPAELAAWLLTLAERSAIDCLRAQCAVKRGRERLVPESSLEEEPVDPLSCPQRRVEHRERLRHFARRCRALSGGKGNGRVFRLVLVAGCTSREAARADPSRLSATGVDTLIHRLRRRLAAEGLQLAARRAG